MLRRCAEGPERLRRRPGHHLRRDRQGRLSGQCLEARSQGHLHHDRDAARPGLARADQAAGLDSEGDRRRGPALRRPDASAQRDWIEHEPCFAIRTGFSLTRRSVGVGFKPEHASRTFFAADHRARISSRSMPRTTWATAGRRTIACCRASRALSAVAAWRRLSIGGAARSTGSISTRLSALIDRYRPALFSEHLAWSTHDGVYLQRSAAAALHAETLDRVCDHIDEVQEALRHADAAGKSLDLCGVRGHAP